MKSYKKHHDFTEKATLELKAKFGNARLTMKEGETPVVPYFTDGEERRIHAGHYSETILTKWSYSDLMHNFKASVRPQAALIGILLRITYQELKEQFTQFMLCLRYQLSDGAYGNPRNSRQEAFCTYRHMDSDVECNMGDQGNAVDHGNLNSGIDVLGNTSVKSESDSTLNPYSSHVENALKVLEMKDQLNDTDLSKALDETKVFTKLCNAKAFR